MDNKQRDDYTPAQTAKRRDEVLKHMLNTPPSPRISRPKSRKKAGAGSEGSEGSEGQRFPQTLVGCFGCGSVSFLIRHPLADDTAQRLFSTLSIRHLERHALVVPKIEFAQVPL